MPLMPAFALLDRGGAKPPLSQTWGAAAPPAPPFPTPLITQAGNNITATKKLQFIK